MSINKGWLSKEDFDKLDDLFSKMGYGGYYDFLQCLKSIASEIGAIYVMKKGDLQAWDLEDLKTISEVQSLITAWSLKIGKYMNAHPEWIDEILRV